MTGLQAEFVVERPAFRLDVALAVPDGSITAVVGPNGSGKTTTLRTLAGLLAPTSGRITLSDAVLDDSANGVHLEPAKRRTGVVFQDYLLFPHLNAADNVAFGMIAGGTPHREARERAHAWLERFGLGEFASIRPPQLSGGQAQRVAVARALALEPPLLLLDEPMSALDATTRVDVRQELKTQLASFGGATVLITHDADDALALADNLVVLERGRIVQTGTPSAVAAAPLNAYVAGLFR